MPARCCFPLPASVDDEMGALLEPLGVALHAVDMAHLRVGHTVAVLGCGPIGLLILQLALRAGADRVWVTDRLAWRLTLARRLGGIPVNGRKLNAASEIQRCTGGRGVDVAFEAAWGEETVAEAAEMARFGGRVVLVGIPSGDGLTMKHSTVRRKGLTAVMSRRMKHVYPRCLQLAQGGHVALSGLVSHRFSLREAPEAFALNSNYQDRVVKVMIGS
jgi:L-iditol 2-dehydrogenase